MKMNVFGPPGSGKSTLAGDIGALLDIHVVHLDSLGWNPNWILASRDEFAERLECLKEHDSYVVDGNWTKTIDLRVADLDTLIYIDVPTRISLFRIIKRYFQNRGTTRPDMKEGCPDKLDFEFIKYTFLFNKNKRNCLLEMINSHNNDKEIIILKSQSDKKEFLKRLKEGV